MNLAKTGKMTYDRTGKGEKRMKNVMMFYLESCGYCDKARRALVELRTVAGLISRKGQGPPPKKAESCTPFSVLAAAMPLSLSCVRFPAGLAFLGQTIPPKQTPRKSPVNRF